MASIQANVILHTTSGIEEDYCQNTWVFSSVGGAVGDLVNDAEASLETFYTSISPNLSPVLTRGSEVHEIVSYDISGELAAAGSGIGSPIGRSLFPLAAPVTNTGLPAEVALCLSFRGSIVGAPVEGPGNTRPRSRRTGRVYLGPLCAGAASEASGTAATRPTTNCLNQVWNAAIALMGAPEHFWCVWSRAENQLYTVETGWVDNSFDTQRRRGPAPTVRSTFP